MTQEVKIFKLFDQAVLVPMDTYSPGLENYDFKVFSGSRILTTLFIKSIDPGTVVSIEVLNNFSVDGVPTWDSILSFSSNTVGYVKRITTDFNKFFRYKVTVTNGNVEFALGISVFDNSATTVIENAEIDVHLSDKNSGIRPYDIVRIGDGTKELKINSNDEAKVHDEDVLDKLQEVVDAISGDNDTLPTGAATEAKQDAQISLATTANSTLTSVLTEVQLNLKQKILKANDRISTEVYLDFGTKNERISTISYTAASVGVGPGFTALKTFNYVLDGNSYRRTTTIWTII